MCEAYVEAKRLVETDRKWARIMSAPPGQSELDSSDEPRFVQAFKENLEFTGGLAVKYDASSLIGGSKHQGLAKGLEVGRRFHSAPSVRLADAKQMQLGHVAEADGRWRIYAFADKGDTGGRRGSVHQLSQWLENDPSSPIVQHRRKDEDIDALIEVIAVFQQTFEDLSFEEMPALLRPKTGKLGLMNYQKVYCVDHKGLGDVFDMREIDRAQGCMVVVRPDQYIAQVLPLDAVNEFSAFFAGIYYPT